MRSQGDADRRYADGAKMLTVGGIIFDQGLSSRVDSCGFSNIDYVRTDGEAFLIEPPNLTFREIRYLDSLLPLAEGAEITLQGVPPEDIKRYASLYGYFPHFTEAEL